MRYTYTILTFCILFSSCKKDEFHNIPSSEYFPNTIGDYWRYKYFDSVANKSQFVDVNITGNATLPGGQNASVWTYTFLDHVDTNFVYQVGDTIRFADRGATVLHSYVVPLQLNNQWRTSPGYIYDTTQVIDNRTYNLNDQNFNNSFLLFENGWLPNDQWNRLEWFCPTIGMITKNERGMLYITNQPSSVYWELVRYDLK